MPAGMSVPAMENGTLEQYNVKNPPAFTIIQKDHLESTLPILHLNGDLNGLESNVKLNNAKNRLYENRRLSKSNDHLILASLQSQQKSSQLRRNNNYCTRSHGNLEESTKLETLIKPPMTMSTENFNEILNAKLRRIQEDDTRSKKSTHKVKISK